MLDGLVLRAHDLSCRAIGRSTTDWRARSAGNWLCRRRQVLADYLRQIAPRGVSGSEATRYREPSAIPVFGMHDVVVRTRGNDAVALRRIADQGARPGEVVR